MNLRKENKNSIFSAIIPHGNDNDWYERNVRYTICIWANGHVDNVKPMQVTFSQVKNGATKKHRMVKTMIKTGERKRKKKHFYLEEKQFENVPRSNAYVVP